MGMFSKWKSAPVEARMSDSLRERMQAAAKAPFAFAQYHPGEGEMIGYSDYSYWGSTFRAFLKNRVALTLFCVLLALLLFTFIQPILPGQYPANLIINHPITQIQMSNIAPSLTTVKTRVEAGTELIVTPYENERWSAVSNVIASLKAREQFTVLEYGDAYCYVEINGQRGYVKNDFTTKLKLPEDYTKTPYTARSNFPIKLYSSPADCTNNGDALFVETRYLDMDGDHAVTNAACALRILPSTAPFLFGTNNLGQDLWAMVWSGTRTSLFIGFMVAVIEAFTGIVVGVLWGYVRRLDRLLTAVYNVVDNVPTTIVLVLISYIMRPGDYNLASRCLGTSTLRIITRNLLPYLVSVITLRMALAIPGAIGNEVFITYIGLGLPVSTPSLGNLINTGRKLISTSQSYQLVFPTIVLSIITISFYLIGNAFADAADPKNHV